MALSTELREALVRRRPKPRITVDTEPVEVPTMELKDASPGDDPNDNPDPDDCVLAALPSPSPDWSHILGGRPHEAASGPLARMALLAVGCRLGYIHRQTLWVRPPDAVARVRCAGCWRWLTASEGWLLFTSWPAESNRTRW